MKLTVAQADELIAAAVALYWWEESGARNSYTSYAYDPPKFNDQQWRASDPDGFKVAHRLRRALNAIPAGRAALRSGGET